MKNGRSQNFDFLGKKIWRNALDLKSKKVLGVLGKRLFCHYRLRLSLVYKTLSQISFNLFCSGDKRLLSEFLRKWDWLHGHNERFTSIPWLKIRKKKFQKTETRFCRWKCSGYNNTSIFLSLENPCAFSLAKEKTWKRMFDVQKWYRKTNYAMQNNRQNWLLNVI